MKNFTLSLAFLLGCSFLSFSQEEEKYNVEKIVAAVNRSLENSVAEINSSNVTLTGASITLKTTVEKTTDGSVKFWVIKGGGSQTKSSSGSITYAFSPPDDIAMTKELAGIDPIKIEEGLKNLIVEAAKSYARMKNNPISGLAAKNIVIELSFSVKKAAEGGIGFELFGVEAGAGAGVSTANAHSIKLSFAS
ncbi:MAG: trypco2 family protein [Cryomorphaceae bacterium]